MLRRTLAWTKAALFAALSLTAPNRALDFNIPFPGVWTGGSGSWTSLNWAPQPLDYAEVLGIPIPFPTWPDNLRSEVAGLGFNYLVAIPDGSPRLDNNMRVGTLALNPGAGLRLREGAELELDGLFGFEGGSVFNDGDVELDENSSITAGLGALLLEGDGTVWIKDSGSSLFGSVIEHGRGHTIRGHGDITAIGLIDNRGDILGDFAPGTTLKLDAIAIENEGTIAGRNGGRADIETETFDNDGVVEADGGLVRLDASSAENDNVFRAMNGGNLQVSSTELDNRGGLIHATTGASVDFRESALLEGGRLATDGSGVIRLLEGAVNLKGQFVNAGLLQGSNAAVNLIGVTLLNTPEGIYEITQNSPTVTTTPLHLSGGTIRGGGLIDATELVTLDGTESGMELTNITLKILGPGFNAIGRLTVTNTVTNHGRILLDGAASLTTLSNTSFRGTGDIFFSTVPPNNAAQTWVGAGVVTNGPGHTIRGGVHAGHGQFDLVNEGSIVSDTPRQMVLEFSNDRSITNTGEIMARNGALLLIRQGRIENKGGVIGAGQNGVLELHGTPSVAGGTIGGDSVTKLVSALHLFGNKDPMTVEDSAVVQVLSAAVLHAYGTLTNDGEIFLNNTGCCGSGPETRLTAVEPVRLLGTGRVTLGPVTGNNNAINATSDEAVITVGPEQSITTRADGGGGTITARIDNYGAVGLNGPGTISIINTAFTNRNSLFARTKGSLRLGGNSLPIYIDNLGGSIEAGAESLVDYSSSAQPATVFGGTLRGAGQHRLVGRVVLDGSVEALTLDETYLYVPGNTWTEVRGNLLFRSATVYMVPSTGGLGSFGPSLTMAGPVHFLGEGQILFGPTYLGNASVLTGDHLTIGPGITLLTTNGTPAVLKLPLDNQGAIIARVGNISLENASLVNNGLIRAEAGGVIRLPSSSSLTNDVGRLEAVTGGRIELNSGPGEVRLRGGVLQGDGIFSVAGYYAYLDAEEAPINLRQATLQIPGNSDVYAKGTIQLDNGLFTLRDHAIGLGTRPASLVLSAPLTFGGNGVVAFDSFNGNTDNQIHGAALTIAPGVRLTTTNRASGVVMADLINQGIIDTDEGAITILGDHLLNEGMIRAAPSRTLTFGSGAESVVITNKSVIQADSSATIALNRTRIAGGELRGPGTFAVGSPTVELDGSLEELILRDTEVVVPGSSLLAATGVIRLENARLAMRDNVLGLGTLPARLASTGPLLVTGNGTVDFDSFNGHTDNEIIGDPLTIDTNVTIRTTNNAAGILRVDLVNRGSIESAGRGITLHSATIQNEGSIRVSGTSPMIIGSASHTVSITNRGAIHIETNSYATFNRAVIDGGTIKGGGRIDVAGLNENYLLGDTDPVVISESSVFVHGHSTLNVRGSIQFQNGRIVVQDNVIGLGTRDATLAISGPVHFGGSGTLQFSAVGNGLENTVLGDLLTLGPEMQILAPQGYRGTFRNAVISAGRTTAHGVITFDAVPMTNEAGGVVQGRGYLEFLRGSVLRNFGTIAPGASAGALTVTGPVANEAGAVHEFEIGGTAPANHDRLIVYGPLALAGKLRLSLINEYAPVLNDSFTLITGAPLTGTFDTIEAPALPAGFAFKVTYQNNSVVLRVAEDDNPLAHYNQWAAVHSVTLPGEDPDGDGLVNFGEYVMNLDPTKPSEIGRPTPEIVPLEGQLYPALRVRRSIGAVGYRFELIGTPALSNAEWTDVPFIVEKIGEIDSETESIHIRDLQTLPSGTARFLKLQIKIGN